MVKRARTEEEEFEMSSDEEDQEALVKRLTADSDDEDEMAANKLVDSVLSGASDSSDDEEGEDENGEDDDDVDISSYLSKPTKRQKLGAQQDVEFKEVINEEPKATTTSALTPEQQQLILQQQGGGMVADEEDNEPAFSQQEIRALKETENLFSSSLFRLAFTEILREVAIDWDKNKSTEIALHTLKQQLEKVKEQKFTVSALFKEFLPADKCPQLYKFLEQSKMKEVKIPAPTQVSVVGSFLLRSVSKPHENVDVTITMPDKYFTDSNFNKFQYHVKRAAYVCAVAKHLKQFKMFEKLEVNFFRGDKFKPILTIYPKKDADLAPKFVKSSFKINILPAISESLFSKQLKATDEDQSVSQVYRHSIMEDQLFFSHLQLLHTAMKDCPSMVETIALYKVWARQRLISSRTDSVNGFLFSVLLVYLLMNRNINKHMSPFQILKIVMHWIANSKIESGFLLKDSESKQKIEDPTKFKGFDFLMLDGEQRFNIFHRVSASAWKELQHEAVRSLSYFEESERSEAIESLFLRQNNLWHKYDLYLRIANINKVDAKKLDEFKDISFELALQKKIEMIFETAMKDRFKLIRVIPAEDGKSLLVGLICNEDWGNPLIKGPNPLDKEQKAQFDAFWGEKSKMRKFQDGSILMCSYFPQPRKHKVSVVQEIARYVLSSHIGVEAKSVRIVGKKLYTYLYKPEEDALLLYRHMEDAFKKVQSAILNSNFYLEAQTVTPTSAEFRKTAIHPTKINTNISSVTLPEEVAQFVSTKSKHADILKVVLEFRHDSRWPDGSEAILKLKQLIYLHYAKSLPFKTFPAQNWIDIVCDGFVFRVAIRLEKEIQIYKTTGHALDPKVIALEREFYQAPLHSTWINTFQGRHASFVEAVRLAKKWVHAHLFSDFVFEELIEVLVAYVYAHPYPYEAPLTEFVGFMRFINLLATHSWKDTPLFVNFAVDTDQKEQANRDFENIQRDYEMIPPQNRHPMYVVASYNREFRNFWTRQKPSGMIVQLLIQYAKATSSVLETLFSEDPSTSAVDTWKGIFRTSFSNFDLVLHLEPQVLEHPERFIDGSDAKTAAFEQNVHRLLKKKSETETNKSKKQKNNVLIGFKPVDQFIELLRQRFSRNDTAALIFRDASEGNDKIALSWNPGLFLAQDFNITKSSFMFPLEGTMQGKVVPNIFEILQDIKSAGKGIVKRVEVVKNPIVKKQ